MLLNTVKEPGINPDPDIWEETTQYLFPVFPPAATKTYWVAPSGGGFAPTEERPTNGSPKSGSAWSRPKNS